MNNPKPKLIIRTQLPLVDTSEREPLPDEVVYLWDRIIIAALVALLVLSAGGYGIWQWLQAPTTNPAAELVSAKETSTPASQSATATASQPAKTAEDEKVTAKPLPVTPATKAASGANEPKPSPVKTASTSEKSGAIAATKSTVQPAVQTRAASPTTPTAQTQPTSTGVARAAILSPQVMRAQLARGMYLQEPLNHAQAVIPMTPQGLVKVYFFTELKDLKGQTLHYDWYRGGRRVARVTSVPTSAPAKSFSSKYIDKGMLGAWKVELRGANDAVLAHAEFEVR